MCLPISVQVTPLGNSVKHPWNEVIEGGAFFCSVIRNITIISLRVVRVARIIPRGLGIRGHLMDHDNQIHIE